MSHICHGFETCAFHIHSSCWVKMKGKLGDPGNMFLWKEKLQYSTQSKMKHDTSVIWYSYQVENGCSYSVSLRDQFNLSVFLSSISGFYGTKSLCRGQENGKEWQNLSKATCPMLLAVRSPRSRCVADLWVTWLAFTYWESAQELRRAGHFEQFWLLRLRIIHSLQRWIFQNSFRIEVSGWRKPAWKQSARHKNMLRGFCFENVRALLACLPVLGESFHLFLWDSSSMGFPLSEPSKMLIISIKRTRPTSLSVWSEQAKKWNRRLSRTTTSGTSWRWVQVFFNGSQWTCQAAASGSRPLTAAGIHPPFVFISDALT